MNELQHEAILFASELETWFGNQFANDTSTVVKRMQKTKRS